MKIYFNNITIFIALAKNRSASRTSTKLQINKSDLIEVLE